MARLTQLSLLLVIAACSAKTAVPFEALDAGQTLVQAGDAGSALDAGWPLTGAQLDAWLGYQRQMMLKLDAGTLERARRERAIRADAGLSEDEVDAIEDVVAAVVTSRNIAKLTGGDAMREFEKATSALPAALRAKAPTVGAGATLEAERARFGEAAVNAVVAREAEVTKVWDALVEAR